MTTVYTSVYTSLEVQQPFILILFERMISFIIAILYFSQSIFASSDPNFLKSFPQDYSNYFGRSPKSICVSGNYLYTVNNVYTSGNTNVFEWDLETGASRTLTTTDPKTITCNNDYLVILQSSTPVEIYDIKTWSKITTLTVIGTRAEIFGNMVIILTSSGDITTVKLSDGSTINTIGSSSFSDMKVIDTSVWTVSGSTLKEFDVSNLSFKRDIAILGNGTSLQIAASNSLKFICVGVFNIPPGSFDNSPNAFNAKIEIYDLLDGQRKYTFNAVDVMSILYYHNMVFVGDNSGVVKQYDPSGTMTAQYQGSSIGFYNKISQMVIYKNYLFAAETANNKVTMFKALLSKIVAITPFQDVAPRGQDIIEIEIYYPAGTLDLTALPLVAVSNGRICSNVNWVTDFKIRCKLPIVNGDPAELSIDLTPTGLKSTLSSNIYFAKPKITSHSPASANCANSEVLTLVVENLADATLDLPHVKVGSLDCTNVVQTSDNTGLTCVLPVGKKPGDTEISLKVSGVSSVDNPSLRFLDPIVNVVNSTASFLTPLGGNSLQIHGSNFGVCSTPPCYTSLVIKLGAFVCSNPQYSSNTLLTCVTPVGFGAGLDVQVDIDGKQSAANTLFSYAPPILTEVNPATFDGVEGTPLLISGKNFGPARNPGTEFKVQIIKKSDPTATFDCKNVIVDSDSSLKCNLPSGLTKIKYRLKVIIGNQESNANIEYQNFYNVAPSFFKAVQDESYSNEPITIRLAATDLEESTELTIKIVTLPERGILFLEQQDEANKLKIGQNITLRKDGDQFSINVIYKDDQKGGWYPFQSFSYRVYDSEGASPNATAIVRISVSCLNGLSNYIWSETGSPCSSCLAGAICYPGGDRYPTNMEGYYGLVDHTASAESKLQFVPCATAEACPQGYFKIVSKALNDSTMTCGKGYGGDRCGQCVSNYDTNEIFYRRGVQCLSCPSERISSTLLIVLAIAGLVVILILVNLIKKIDLGFLSILVTFVQTISIFISFKLKWPEQILRFFNAFSFFNLNIEVAAPECFVIPDNSKSYEYKWYTSVATPLALLLLILFLIFAGLFVTWFIRSLFGYRKSENISKNTETRADASLKVTREAEDDEDESVREKNQEGREIEEMKKSIPNLTLALSLIGNYVFYLKFMYLSLAKTVIELHNCLQVGGQYFYEAEPNRYCYHGWWYDMLPYDLAGIFFYVFGIPALMIFLQVKRQRIRKLVPLEKRNTFDKVILILTFKKKSEFKDQFEYWETYLAIRKLMVVLIQLFFTKYPIFQSIVLALFFILALNLHMEIKPYSMKTLNWLEFTTLLATAVILLSGVLFKVQEFDQENEIVMLAYFVISIIIISMTFVLSAMVFHVKHMLDNYRKVQAKKAAKILTQ